MRLRLASTVPPLAVLGSVTLLCTGTSLAKPLFGEVGAAGASALRVGFSALFLCLLWRPWRQPLTRRDALYLAAYGASLGMMNLLFYLALRTLPLGIAVAMEFSGPLAVALLSSRRWIDGLWLLLAISGLALLLPLHGAASLDPLGLVLILGAAACWAVYICFGKAVGHLPSGPAVAWGLLAASVVVVPFGVVAGGARLWHAGPLLHGVAIAIISSAIPISLEMIALKRLPRETYGILVSMEPAVAGLIGWALLGERLLAQQWMAIVLVLCASAGCSVTARIQDEAPIDVPTGPL
ncbi:EamA family transporter [Frateuria aurantia]